MPDSSIFSALPGTGDLSLSALPSSIPLPKLDTDLGALKTSLMGSVGGGAPAVEMPDLSGAPSGAGFRNALEEPLSSLTSVDAKSLIDNAKGSLPVEMPKASFDVNGVVSQITSQVLPAEASGSMDTDIGLPSALGDFTGPLRRLAEAGAATPLRMLNMMLTILDRLVTTATDADKLKQFTAEALGEILVAQVQNLRDVLPLAALEQARAPFDAGFLDRYQALLAQLDRVQDAAGPELLATVQAVRNELVPAIRHAGAATGALGYLKAGDADPVTRAVQAVVGFSTTDAVFLQPMFDRVETTIGTVVDAIAGPVQQLAGMIGQIKAYLEMAADKAEAAATGVSDKLSATLRTLAGHLETAQTRITELEEKVRAFIDKVDVGPVIEKFKAGLVTVVDGVDSFFTQVESVRKQLDDAVAKLDAEVRVKFKDGLTAVEGQIRGMLDQITGVLDKPEVKDVLDQARQGVEKLKKAIEEASLQQVFDLVISKTGALEGKIQAIDTSRMGTPQKTALKVGVKIIQEVKVDDIVKPELEAAFAQIMGPLRELIQLLKDKVLFVEQKIDEFAPGTLVTNAIEPYLKPVFDALEGFRPSQLLQPLKDALDYLTGLLEELDPQKLLDVVQGLYDQLGELVDSLEPTPLNGMIAGAANTATAQLAQVRDVYLDDIVRTIKETVSLTKLLEGTGIQEIADAEFWDLLRKWLGGAFLDVISTAVERVETQLGAEFGGLDYGAAAAAVADVAKAVDAQGRVTADAFLTKVTSFQALLEGSAVRMQQLDAQRRALLDAGPARPEVEAVLRELALQPALDLAAALKTAAAQTPAATGAALE
ncbi:MAG TPA: hypothetical protein VNP72_11375, partial [Longimicrobium sp.]|nr:hypothetical protein [Longimicrobium sp.]